MKWPHGMWSMAIGGQSAPWIVLTPQSTGEDWPPEQGGACPRAPRKVVTEVEILVGCTWHGLSDSYRSLLPLSQDSPSEAVRRLQCVGPEWLSGSLSCPPATLL